MKATPALLYEQVHPTPALEEVVGDGLHLLRHGHIGVEDLTRAAGPLHHLQGLFRPGVVDIDDADCQPSPASVVASDLPSPEAAPVITALFASSLYMCSPLFLA